MPWVTCLPSSPLQQHCPMQAAAGVPAQALNRPRRLRSLSVSSSTVLTSFTHAWNMWLRLRSPPGPCKMWNKSFISICLAVALLAPSGSLRNTLLFYLMLIRRHRGKERKAGGCSGQAGARVWRVLLEPQGSSPLHTCLETTTSPTGLQCWWWPGQQHNGPSQLASSTTLF